MKVKNRSNKGRYFLAVFIFMLGIAFFAITLVVGMTKLDQPQQGYLLLGSIFVLLVAIFAAAFLVLKTLNDSLEGILDHYEENGQETVVKE